jgi:hypothetical protein
VSKRKKKCGRPPYKRSKEHEEVVRALAIYGAPYEKIAVYLKINVKTLRKHYYEVLITSRLQFGAKAVSVMASSLNSPNPQMAFSASKYVLSTIGKRNGWSLAPEVPDLIDDVDMSRLNVQDLNELLRILEKAKITIQRPVEIDEDSWFEMLRERKELREKALLGDM